MKRFLLLLLLFAAISVQARPGLLDSLGLNDDVDIPPSVDEAFNFSAQIKGPLTLIAQWNIAEGNYLYRDKIRFEIIDNTQVQLLDFSLPAGENKMDEIFGLTEVYSFDTSLTLPLKRDGSAQQITLKAYYQGCSETFHICYPPTVKSIQLSLPAFSGDKVLSKTAAANTSSPTISWPEQDRIAQSLAQDSIVKILVSFFGLGLLLAFTPCVFPMIPILSSIIVGEGERITTHRAFILSLAYVLAMSVTYTVAGVLTGLLGENLQTMLQNPWIIGSFSALFVILALSMFGLFELHLPQTVQHRLHKISHQQKGGKIAGAALMGLLSGLIVGPCLAPPLAGALIFIGQQGDPVLGGSALFALSMGMGLPLLIIGTSAGTLLPKAGSWMNTVKAVFGVLMLALAIWMLERIIPGWISLLLWGALFIVTAIYLGALNTLHIDSTGQEKLWKGVGLILLIYGSLLMIGGTSGSQNVWQPLQNISTVSHKNNETSTHLAFIQIHNLTDLNQQLSLTNKPAILDFYADWCTDCKRMEATTFKDAGVKAALADFHLLQLDMTDNTAEHKAILKQFGVFGPPSILFFDPTGKEHKRYRLVGSITATSLIDHLAKLPGSTL
ncbi:MAG: cytochrome C biogenesis protein [Methylophaga sp.]|nr:MAG: cytochrome C biogenesis protein [Methylophaga sp.]